MHQGAYQCFVPPPLVGDTWGQRWGFELLICDALSENLAHRAFYENQDKTGNRYANVQLCGKEKMEVIGCLVPELQSEMHNTTFRKNAMFLRCYGKF